MAKNDSETVEQSCTEVFELVGQDIEGLALALTLAAQLMEEQLLEPADLLEALTEAHPMPPITIH